MSSLNIFNREGQPESHERWLRWGFAIFLAIALFFLWEEHRAHLLGALPWILLLACPAMHFLRHRRHGPKDHAKDAAADAPRSGTGSEHQHGTAHERGGYGCC
jgi:hypothetical protein